MVRPLRGRWLLIPLLSILAAYGQTATGFNSYPRTALKHLDDIKELDGRNFNVSLREMKRVLVPSRYSVRATVAALLRDGDASLQRTAHQLDISPRSLQRHLTGMGTSYSELVAEVRLDTACHLLTESELSIAEIAYRLGYSGSSSFSRIFMRLMKIQPAVYRRQRMAEVRGWHGDDGRRRATKGP